MTALPAAWLLLCTSAAGLIKLFDPNPAVGFTSLARKYSDAVAAGQLIAPAKSMEQMIADGDLIGAYLAEMQTILSGKIAEGAETSPQ